MAILAWPYNRVPVKANVRTRIAQGPLVHGFPAQWVVFEHNAGNVANTYTIAAYSGAPPWGLTTSGMGMVWNVNLEPSMPWQAGVPLWLLASPWVEVYVTSNIACMASFNAI